MTGADDWDDVEGIQPVRINWLGLNPTAAMRCLGQNMAVAGALFEAARRARITCPACRQPPCNGKHPDLVGPCCSCCPVPAPDPAGVMPGVRT